MSLEVMATDVFALVLKSFVENWESCDSKLFESCMTRILNHILSDIDAEYIDKHALMYYPPHPFPGHSLARDPDYQPAPRTVRSFDFNSKTLHFSVHRVQHVMRLVVKL